MCPKKSCWSYIKNLHTHIHTYFTLFLLFIYFFLYNISFWSFTFLLVFQSPNSFSAYCRNVFGDVLMSLLYISFNVKGPPSKVLFQLVLISWIVTLSSCLFYPSAERIWLFKRCKILREIDLQKDADFGKQKNHLFR